MTAKCDLASTCVDHICEHIHIIYTYTYIYTSKRVWEKESDWLIDWLLFIWALGFERPRLLITLLQQILANIYFIMGHKERRGKRWVPQSPSRACLQRPQTSHYGSHLWVAFGVQASTGHAGATFTNGDEKWVLSAVVQGFDSSWGAQNKTNKTIICTEKKM